ncbi:MAG: trypsin-like peptidase domain-containing protein [Planctomycetes bacterium]|nr:trypsin-like peptidase domain-containing protein [Planctomycetota bacterium]
MTALGGALLAAVLLPQQDPDLAAVLAAEARRTQVMAECAAAVCSVMAMDAPGGGSGVVFHPAGFVLTNYHVVGDPDEGFRLPDPPAPPAAELDALRQRHPDLAANDGALLAQWQQAWRAEHLPRGAAHYRHKKVGLPDGLLYEAEVLGIDPGSDLAVLRLLPKHDGQTWPFRPLGDSDALLVGQTVFAMGNPFLLATDFTPTVTFGIVSGTHRYQEGSGNRMLVYPDCIQVDAPVNPGNSGGPLFNEQGEVVGINGRISIGDRGRVNVGVGFAIASNQIRNFLPDLMAGRHAEHGTLDLSAWFMTSGTGANHRRTVLVQQMFKDSVAAAAGIALGDEITRFNGQEVRSANQLATMVGVLPAGTIVSVGYRPRQADDSFGDEREVVLRLATLDTGSSKDGPGGRLASANNRRFAAQVLLHEMGRIEDDVATALQWTRTGPDGTATVVRRDGDRLCLTIGPLVLVWLGDGGFARDGEQVRDLTSDEAERVRREFVCNPLLCSQVERVHRLAGTELLGGVQVFGRPAWRFAVRGDGDGEVWLHTDGSPAGFAFRDPLRRARVEHHVRGTELRVTVDGVFEPGWRGGDVTIVDPDDARFRRP